MAVAIDAVDPQMVATEAADALGLEASATDVLSLVGLAASIRRAASFLCPTSPGALVRAVMDVLRGLPGFHSETRTELERLVESLVSYGDLLELVMDEGNTKRRQVFLGPPAFVLRPGNAGLLVGIRPEGAPLLSDELADTIDYEGHARFIRSTDDHPIGVLLESEGLIELKADQWLKAPRPSHANELVGTYVSRLQAAGASGDIEGARVIDPASRVNYYRGRWRVLNPRDAGHFVARRPQAYGADRWCFAEVVSGEITRLVDLPLQLPFAHGADEAWRLQAALDAVAGDPQHFRVRSAQSGTSRIDFFSPLPSWMQRRLDVIGVPVPGSRGALFSYRVGNGDVDAEVDFLEDMMWLVVEGSSQGADDDE
jgi:hypothetical protein